MLSQRDVNHNTVFKIRRCFLWQNTYFQMDIYKAPVNELCFGLILLDTYTTLSGEALKAKLPNFLEITREVTNDPMYSMYNLSMKTRRQSAPVSLSPFNSIPAEISNRLFTNDLGKVTTGEINKKIRHGSTTTSSTTIPVKIVEEEKEVNNNNTEEKMNIVKGKMNGIVKENK